MNDPGKKLMHRVLPVCKSAGISTYDCIRRFKKVTGKRKVGHAGTLDPLATGLVLLLTDEATKLSNYLMDLPKRYVAEIKLGASTDTQDASGRIVLTGDWTGTGAEDVERVLAGLIGRRKQTPPMYSALKHEGRPLYLLARQGRHVEREPRDIETYEIKLLSCELPLFRIEVFCSRGLYLRVLAEEIGAKLGVPAHLNNLTRIGVGHFTLDDAVGDDEFDRLARMERPGYSMADAVGHLHAMRMSAEQARELENGVPPRRGGGGPHVGGLVRLIRPDGSLGGIGLVAAGGMIELRRVFARV